MLTSNYEVLQISHTQKGKYKVGDIFDVPPVHRGNWRFMKFDELEIKSIHYGFGIFLHFDRHQWRENNPPIEKIYHKPSSNIFKFF